MQPQIYNFYCVVVLFLPIFFEKTIVSTNLLQKSAFYTEYEQYICIISFAYKKETVPKFSS